MEKQIETRRGSKKQAEIGKYKETILGRDKQSKERKRKGNKQNTEHIGETSRSRQTDVGIEKN